MHNIVKCHRCKHVWGYSGDSLTTICPDCKTTIRVQKCLIPCKWDYDITGEKPDQTIIPGMIVQFIEKWGKKLTLKFFLFSEEDNPSNYGQILEFAKLRHTLKNYPEFNPTRLKSGAIPIPESLKESLKKIIANKE
jgi:hypothetical protein